MKVVILGLGQYPQGSGMAAALFFARAKAEVVVMDFYYSDAMKKNAAQLKKFKNVRCIFNKHPLDEIKKADLVIKHQRIRMNEPEVVEALKHGIPIESAESIFLKRCPCPVVGITGTRGKSTTTHLVADMLKASGRRVWLGGNMLVAPLTFLSKIKPMDLVVLELSSFQLEGTGLAGISPHVACLTNLLRDHLNAYPSMEEYGEAKAQIFRHQTPEDAVVLNGDDAFCRTRATEAAGLVSFFTKKKTAKSNAWIEGDRLMIRNGQKVVELSSIQGLHIFGEHNYLNILAAALTAKAAGATISGIQKAVVAFKGLPNRQEVVAVKKGVAYINDTTATTPDGTIAAIRALSPRYRTLRLIIGGADKELDFVSLAKELKGKNIDIVVLPGTAHDALTRALAKRKVSYAEAASLPEAFRLLTLRAQKNDAVVLSPGCASFGLFSNEFARGAAFVKLVKGLR